MLGETSANGFWSYFPVAFIVKTPLPTLVLLVVALVSWGLRPSRRRTLLVLLIPPLLYFLAAMWSKLNIGLRHILPIYPFIFVVVGAIAAELWTSKTTVKRGFLIVLACWYVWSSAMIYPHYLVYFNELAGGPANGHRVLIDSNLDWGQDLKGLKRWMDRHGQTSIQLHYFGSIYPEYYGIQAFHLPGSSGALQSPQHEKNFHLPEYLAISVNRLFGKNVFINQAQKRFIDSYKLGQPIDHIGYSILIYKLNLADAMVPYNAGGILARRGELDHAVEQFREALRIQPEFADAHSELAQVLTARGNRDEAVKHYNEALRILKAAPRSPKNG